MNDKDPIPYSELSRVADQILENGEDQPEILARELERLPPEIRDELLTSDLLNAFQVFYYFFREDPGDLERDRLTLQPASALLTGVLVTEIDLFDILFSIDAGEPVLSVSDGDQVIARYRGVDAFRKAIRFLDESL
ncbi:MAG: hypothetical protein MUE45_02140 [Methanoregulaceae archaeon]|nr:hypothetical protein [Methanoregulaceae archaeon]MCU0628280.1 hypothetical protein [Methanoregulaceae archaeon]